MFEAPWFKATTDSPIPIALALTPIFRKENTDVPTLCPPKIGNKF
jgi:hypothetical protein